MYEYIFTYYIYIPITYWQLESNSGLLIVC